MKFETLVVHAARTVDPTGAVVPPIHLATTFERDAENEPIAGFTYVRESNPTQVLLERALSELEGGEAALTFGSGMAAGIAVLQSLPAKSHVIFPDDVYFGYRAAFDRHFAPAGMTADYVAMRDVANVRAKLRSDTKLLWLETPSNPLVAVADLAAMTELARAHNVLTVVDNTWATPALQLPIKLGADIVLHSTTKYFGGHSDVQGGALVFAKKSSFHADVAKTRHLLGAVAAPFNSWLVLRGLRTLACRVERQSATALIVARALEANPAIKKVHYPGLESDAGHGVAAKQMSGFGAMMSVRAESRAAALAILSRVKLFVRATSLGGVESLIEHRASSEGPTSTTAPELLRISIGLEAPSDLVDDLAEACAGGLVIGK